MQHGRRHGYLREIVPRLRIVKGDAPDAKTRVLEDAALDGDVGLVFGKIPGLHVHQRLEAERVTGVGYEPVESCNATRGE